MKNKIHLFIVLLLAGFGLAFVYHQEQESTDWQNGDIVFQDSESTQSLAIKLATNSKYNHCGIVLCSRCDITRKYGVSRNMKLF
jgi:hypothetical protein